MIAPRCAPQLLAAGRGRSLLALLVGRRRHDRLEPARRRASLDLGLPLATYGALVAGLARCRSTASIDTLVHATPLILAGLSVGLVLQGRPVQHRRPGPVPHGRPGAAAVGAALADAPPLVAIPAGAPGRLRRRRRSTASSPASLKAYTGAHEVVTTIMLNYIAVLIVVVG